MFEILDGYVTQYDMATTPPTPASVTFESVGLTVGGVLDKDDKATTKAVMADLGLSPETPFGGAAKRARKRRKTLDNRAKDIPPVLWVRKARAVLGNSTCARGAPCHVISACSECHGPPCLAACQPQIPAARCARAGLIHGVGWPLFLAAMKEYCTADGQWDVYMIGTVMQGFFREVFADKLRLGDGGLHGYQVRAPM